MVFDDELKFEASLIEVLKSHGWESEVLKNKTEKELLNNWANILFENNRGVDRLNDYPLTDTEMTQILDQLAELKTPSRISGFINGGSVSVKRDNPEDINHLGKEVSLKIYDRNEIAAGQSRYQIAEQPIFKTKSKMLNNRRGDLMLLINGMPVYHIELKKSNVPVSQAVNQIEKYAHEGVYTGIFSLVQIFVAMNPEETLYFANPGTEDNFKASLCFHWADFNNEPINDWKRIASEFLSIPMAHEMIGFYTVADGTDGALKAMRSYQFWATAKIADTVAKHKWENNNQRGGYIWHTTGSGKTLTSFKSAQLIADSKNADKVLFLMDRIELGTQSLSAYRNFAGAGLTEEQKNDTVQETEDTYQLIDKLKSKDPKNTLIVTSIQKMSNISEDSMLLKSADLNIILSKRIVFIVDECHRDTFGEMMQVIKKTFPKALFFGFTGTPIQIENHKKGCTTSDVFGNELHRYILADGIRDKNVLGFDPYKVMTFKDNDLREAVALLKSKSKDINEAMGDEKKKQVFMKYMQDIPMAGYYDENGGYHSGIEDEIPSSQYRNESQTHQKMVVKDILDNWTFVSQAKKFHAIFATSSILEAIDYYRLFKNSDLKVTALFDPNIDNNDTAITKEDGLAEIIDDYNKTFGGDYTIPTYYKMKKDISNRLAHKDQHKYIEKNPDKQLDLLIVVDQMLTGFDSKWVNALYLDKLLEYENVIQAFSRTNRLFGPEKQFGIIKYYRKPHTMERNIKEAVATYSGDKPFALFVDKLSFNLKSMNQLFESISLLYQHAGVENFEKLPSDKTERRKFAQLFHMFNTILESAKVQGFHWDCLTYHLKDENTDEVEEITLNINKTIYLILVMRYKELFDGINSGEDDDDSLEFDIDGYITSVNTDKIDADYMNSRFVKYIKLLLSDVSGEDDLKEAEEELHKTFATLTQEQQKYANIFLHDIQSGTVVVKIEEGKSFLEYVTEYMTSAKNDQVHKISEAFGIDESMLRTMMDLHVTESNIDDFGRFTSLKETVDFGKAKQFFEKKENKTLPKPLVNIKFDKLLRDFVLQGGFEI